MFEGLHVIANQRWKRLGAVKNVLLIEVIRARTPDDQAVPITM